MHTCKHTCITASQATPFVKFIVHFIFFRITSHRLVVLFRFNTLCRKAQTGRNFKVTALFIVEQQIYFICPLQLCVVFSGLWTWKGLEIKLFSVFEFSLNSLNFLNLLFFNWIPLWQVSWKRSQKVICLLLQQTM